MLSNYAVTAVMPLAEDLASKSLVVHSKPNTVLSELDRTTNSLLLTSGTLTKAEDLDNATYAKYLEAATFNFDAPTQHDAMMDGFLNDIKNAVSGHLKFARNVVKPLVIDYAERFQRYMESVKVAGPDSQYNVEVFEVPAPLEDMVFSETIKKYVDVKNIGAMRPNAACPIAPIGEDKLLELILTGDTEVDQAITSWFTSTHAGNYVEMVNVLMSSPSALIEAFGNRLQPHRNLNQALIVFLVANAIYNKDVGLSDVDSISTIGKKNLVADYRNYAGAILAAYIGQLDLLITNRVVVMEVSNNTRTIYVYGPVFRKWIEEGGKTEHLFAVLSLGVDYRNIDKLRDNADRLQKEWDSYSLFWHNTQANQRLNVGKEGLKIVFKDLMTELTEDEKSYMQTNNQHMVQIDKKLNELIDELRPSDMDQIYTTAMKIICRCRFYFTDAEFILSEIEEIGKVNPNIDPSEAALIATIHYIVDYLCDQVFVTGKI